MSVLRTRLKKGKEYIISAKLKKNIFGILPERGSLFCHKQALLQRVAFEVSDEEGITWNNWGDRISLVLTYIDPDDNQEKILKTPADDPNTMVEDKKYFFPLLFRVNCVDAASDRWKLRMFPDDSEDPNLKVMNGRYGPYITNGTDNFKIPKDMMANKLTYQDCLRIMQETTPTAKKRVVKRKKA